MSGGWNTIESDAGVFTSLLTNLGVSGVQFEELLALEPDDLRALRTVYGVIFLFRWPSAAQSSANANDQGLQDGQHDFEAGERLFFARQVIQNACGTQALLSVLLNHAAKGESGEQGQTGNGIDVGAKMRDFGEFTGAFPSELRGEALSNSELIRDVHNSFARSSPFIDEAQRPATEDDDLYHFIAYTPIGGSLYELDGLQPAPINHGPCSFDQFSDRVIPVLQRRIQRYPVHEIRFNLLAMVQDLRIRAREVGDEETVYREEQKRIAWQWENALRKHNFIGFIGELMKGVTRAKVQEGDGAWDRWIDGAKEKTKTRVEEKRKKGAAAEGEGD